jgi:hypothetical protein
MSTEPKPIRATCEVLTRRDGTTFPATFTGTLEIRMCLKPAVKKVDVWRCPAHLAEYDAAAIEGMAADFDDRAARGHDRD